MIPYTHHGRNHLGCDCVGLIFYIYNLAGCSIDHLDMPYSVDEGESLMVRQLIEDRLSNDFADATRAVIGGWAPPGTILLLREPGGLHLGMWANRKIYEMGCGYFRVSHEMRTGHRILKAFALKGLS